MASPIDSLLAEIRTLSDAISQLAEGPEKEELEEQREELRSRARLMADSTRLHANLEAELASVEEQIAELEDVAIKPAWQERYKFITDPSAYRRRINESIEGNLAARREHLEQRRRELIEALRAQTDE